MSVAPASLDLDRSLEEELTASGPTTSPLTPPVGGYLPWPSWKPPMTPLELTHLPELMALTHGNADVTIGLIDGPVAMTHPDLAEARIREVPGKLTGTCSQEGVACQHGTFVAGVLVAKRGSRAPAICPGCTLLVRPIFSEPTSANGQIPSATPEELAAAIIECAETGARVINVSAGLGQPSARSERALEEALDHASR